MRICILTKFIPPYSTDGIPRNRWEYAKQFFALGHEVHMVISGKENLTFMQDGISIHQVKDWDQELYETGFKGIEVNDHCRGLLTYSYAVFLRIQRLHAQAPFHIIESPLWDLEGYITKLLLPQVPLVVRLETTSMLLREIIDETPPALAGLHELERHFMEQAEGLVFDSWSILQETARLYQINFDHRPYAVIHHGITIDPPKTALKPVHAPDNAFKVIVAGRLEKRKGSDILVEKILPKLTNAENIEIHFAGKDGGEWDGFKKKNGLGYHDYIKKRFSSLIGKRIFLHGYVPDEQLELLYDEANVVLALSRYESFGLLYVEAMRHGKPVIAFDTGATPEIFTNGVDAVLVPISQPEGVLEALMELKANPGKCLAMGTAAKNKLKTHFSAEKMGQRCIAFFEQLLFKPAQLRLLQVMNCLVDRDGVSNTTIDYDKLLRKNGIVTQILGSYSSEAVKHLTKQIHSVNFSETDTVLYHYWNYCERADFFNGLINPRKVFFFHNITTPSFFEPTDEAYANTSKGYEQLKSLDGFDLYVGHTWYSIKTLEQVFNKKIPAHVIPPVISAKKLRSKPFNQRTTDRIKSLGKFTLLFVGTIAPHKKQEQLVEFFNYYKNGHPSDIQLIIVGGGSEKYLNRLKKKVDELKLSGSVVITGKVPDEELYAHYRAADAYLSLSEHEGFGVPMAEALAFEVPVMAYDCTAVPETVGQNGALFFRKDFESMSALLDRIRLEPEFRLQIIQAQNNHLKSFSEEAVFKAIIAMEEQVRSIHLTRILDIKNKSHQISEEYIYAHDDRIAKAHNLALVDNRFVQIPSGDGLQLQVDAASIELCFLNHDWSGKIVIHLNGEEVGNYDLFAFDRGVKTICLPVAEQGLHHLHIQMAAQRNQASKGCEALLQYIRLLRKSTSSIESSINNNNKIDTHHTNGKTLSKGTPHVFRNIESVPANHSAFTYSGDWKNGDNGFRYSSLGIGNLITFTETFNKLSLRFVSHDWSSSVLVTVDGEDFVFDLFSEAHCVKSFELPTVYELKPHKVTISPSTGNKKSKGSEVHFGGADFISHHPIEVSSTILQEQYRVSVIINTLNRAKHLSALLAALEQQSYPYFEVVVVNGPSTDNTAEVLEQYGSRIKQGTCSEANLSMSRNIAIELSAGDFVAFIDDDALPCDEHWVANFIYYIIWNKSQNIGAVGGPVKHKDTEHFEFKNGATSDYGFQIFREEDMKNTLLDGVRWVQGVPGGNNMIKKEALYKIGGFDERFIYYLDETDVCIRLARLGLKIYNNPINHIRHFKAVSGVRKSTYDQRWDIIARSDTFYAMKNGADILPVRLFKVLTQFYKKHFYKEIVQAHREGRITAAEYKEYKRRLHSGFRQGLKWAFTQNRGKSFLQNTSNIFVPFIELPLSETTSKVVDLQQVNIIKMPQGAS